MGVLRVMLSIMAVFFDVLMFALFLAVFIVQGGSTSAPQAAQGAPTPLGIGYAVMGFMLGGFVLNILAIAFGARLPIGRKAVDPAASVASEFS